MYYLGRDIFVLKTFDCRHSGLKKIVCSIVLLNVVLFLVYFAITVKKIIHYMEVTTLKKTFLQNKVFTETNSEHFKILLILLGTYFYT